MTQRGGGKGIRTFLIIWFGQLISLIGSGLTSFALGVYIFEGTHSTTLLAFNMLAFALATIVFSPLAGALVDRWDRRWAMILSDTGSGLSTLAIVILLRFDQLELWHIYLATFVSSAFSTLQWPAYSAATTLLVPKEHYGRASGMVQLGEAVSFSIAPLLAAALFGLIGLRGVFLIDFVTFAFAVGTLLLVRIPRPETTAVGEEAKESLLREAFFGWRYVSERPGLLGLVMMFAGINFFSSMSGPLLPAMLLTLYTPEVLGIVMSIMGAGMLVGTLVMSAWGGPKRRILGVLGDLLISSLSFMLLGLSPSPVLIAIAVFVVMFMSPIGRSCTQAIWQSKVEPDVQGRVFAVRRMIAFATLPLGTLAAGPLADHVFEPLMAVGGPLADTVGRVIGVGPGRGIGLLFLIAGLCTGLITISGMLSPRIRRIEVELPDVVADEASEANKADEADDAGGIVIAEPALANG